MRVLHCVATHPINRTARCQGTRSFPSLHDVRALHVAGHVVLYWIATQHVATRVRCAAQCGPVPTGEGPSTCSHSGGADHISGNRCATGARTAAQYTFAVYRAHCGQDGGEEEGPLDGVKVQVRLPRPLTHRPSIVEYPRNLRVPVPACLAHPRADYAAHTTCHRSAGCTNAPLTGAFVYDAGAMHGPAVPNLFGGRVQLQVSVLIHTRVRSGCCSVAGEGGVRRRLSQVRTALQERRYT
jgi:hypothetical protein